ncbi:MAG: hypothetical protein AAB731_05210 [Patescibacteria group bacterium]
MKRAAFILALMFPATAAADKMDETILVPGWSSAKLQKPKLKFQKKKLWNLAALPAYFFAETALHEGSHAVAAKARGAVNVSYKPYPHMESIGGGARGFFWGSVTYDDPLEGFSAVDEALVTIAPYITDTALFTASDLLLGYAVKPGSIPGLILWSAGMVAPLVNFAVNANGFGAANDFALFAKAAGINRYALLAMSDALVAVGIWRVIARGKEVLWDEVPERPSRVSFVPLFGQMNGAAVGYRF